MEHKNGLEDCYVMKNNKKLHDITSCVKFAV